MREHVPNGDVLFAVAGEVGKVFAHRIVEAQEVPLIEPVDHHGSDRLRCGEDVERSIGPSQYLRHAGRIAGAVAARVADGTVDDDLALATHADLDRRVMLPDTAARPPARCARWPPADTDGAGDFASAGWS
jgi:hypothetical protein